MDRIFPSPFEMIRYAGELLSGPSSKVIDPGKWQGIQIQNFKMVEIFDRVFRCNIPGSFEQLAIETNADLPWAEDHFNERIGEKPTNPGDTYLYWPYYKEDERIRSKIFTHTYQERFWPKRVGKITNRLEEDNKGLRYGLGDYFDVVTHLAKNPYTRQAFLPIWFPEDTGVRHKGRVPCTLGYLFSYREGYLHLTYYIRSCDYIRHFKNDVYMACRLLQHTLELLSYQSSSIDWTKVKPGRLKMDVESLHIFESDKLELKKRLK